MSLHHSPTRSSGSTNVTIENQQREQPAQISAVSDLSTKIKLPDFFAENVELWFWQVESAFIASGIASDVKKYHAIIGQLPSRVIFKLADFKSNPPARNQMYETLKNRIVKEYADSEQTKITKLLEDMSLGDRKPSQLLAEMRTKASNTAINDNFLAQLWMRALPETIRAILSAEDMTPLSDKAATADRIMEAMRNGLLLPAKSVNDIQTNVVQSNSKPSMTDNVFLELKNAIASLSTEVKQLRQSRSNKRSDTPVRNIPNRESSISNSEKHQHDFCWWHFKFRLMQKNARNRVNFNYRIQKTN